MKGLYLYIALSIFTPRLRPVATAPSAIATPPAPSHLISLILGRLANLYLPGEVSITSGIVSILVREPDSATPPAILLLEVPPILDTIFPEPVDLFHQPAIVPSALLIT